MIDPGVVYPLKVSGDAYTTMFGYLVTYIRGGRFCPGFGGGGVGR
jgi:hypothetical protein